MLYQYATIWNKIFIFIAKNKLLLIIRFFFAVAYTS